MDRDRDRVGDGDDQDVFRDHLVDRAKELLHADGRELDDTAPDADASDAAVDGVGPGGRTPDDGATPRDDDPREIKPGQLSRAELRYLARHRERMAPDELRAFLEKGSAFHERLEEADDVAFTRWEERFLLQRHDGMDASELAAALDRDVAAVEAQLQVMGLGDRELMDA